MISLATLQLAHRELASELAGLERTLAVRTATTDSGTVADREAVDQRTDRFRAAVAELAAALEQARVDGGLIDAADRSFA